VKLNKYYSRFDEKPSYILALSTSFFNYYVVILNVDIPVLHPYFKLAYIKMAWGGAEEQEAEYLGGNEDAKNWQDEAQKILEDTVSPNQCFLPRSLYKLDGAILEGPPKSPDHLSHGTNRIP
jgi:hypothetical protein